MSFAKGYRRRWLTLHFDLQSDHATKTVSFSLDQGLRREVNQDTCSSPSSGCHLAVVLSSSC